MVINMNKDFAVRKHIRLKDYDYGSAGSYFITICAIDRKCIFSDVVGRGLVSRVTWYTTV